MPPPYAVALLVAPTSANDALAIVHGETLLAHAVRELLASDRVRQVQVLVSASDSQHYEAALLPGSAAFVLPEPISYAEVLRTAPEHDVVLIHDANRPFTPASTIRAVADAVHQGAKVAAPALPVADTVKAVSEAGVVLGTKDRTQLRTIQSPFGLHPDLVPELRVAPGQLPALPDGAVLIPGHPNAMRIQTAFDRTVAEALVEPQD